MSDAIAKMLTERANKMDIEADYFWKCGRMPQAEACKRAAQNLRYQAEMAELTQPVRQAEQSLRVQL